MRSPKQQFFLLLAVSLSLSFWQTKAFSLDNIDGLNVVDTGSREVGGCASDVQILCQKGSSILEMEEVEVKSPADGNSNDSVTPRLPKHGEGMSPASDSGGLTSTSEHNESQDSSERINRSAAQPSDPDADVQYGRESSHTEDGTPVEIRNAEPSDEIRNEVRNTDEEPVSKKEKKASKKKLSSKTSKSKKALLKEEEVPAVAPARVSPPEVVKPPVTKTASEEAMLSRLVKELEFGTLLNSITLLNQLVAKYPEDPDYNSLLAMAIRLRDGDVWYQYARKVDIKEDKTPKPQVPVQIMKPTTNDTVNELKKSSWFLIRSVKR